MPETKAGVWPHVHLRCVPVPEVASSQTEKIERLIIALCIPELRPYGSRTDAASQWALLATTATCTSLLLPARVFQTPHA